MKEYSVPAAVDVDPSRSITDYLVDHARNTPDKVLLEELVGGTWLPRSASWVLQEVEAIAKGLIASGIGVGDRVGIMAANRIEWTLVDYAIWHAGAVPVPVYETSSAHQAQWILSDSACVAVVAEDADKVTIIEEARGIDAGAPLLRDIWVIEDGALEELKRRGAGVSQEDLDARRAAVGLDDLATIIYTSGTTGRPKGAELTHSNFVRLSVEATKELGEVVHAPGARTLLFIPLAHVFARFVETLALISGLPMGHSIATRAVADMPTFKPTVILSVPHVFEKVYNGAEAKTGGGAKAKIFTWAAKVAITYSRALDTASGPSAALKVQRAVADKLVLSKIRAAMGGDIKYAISGGAPLGERLGHFFRGVGLTVLEGYGLTETTAPTNVARPGHVKMGTVGTPLPGTSIRIADDGEILAKGVPVFRGYHNNPEATAEALVDGWFHTGDLGAMDQDGCLTITGRKKEIIVTAAGKNVAPNQLEDPLRAHPLISQCVVVGDQRPFVSVLITLDEEMLPKWLANHGREPLTPAQAASDPFVREHLQMAVDRANKHVSRAEAIKQFFVLQEDLTVENGYLTPSLKMRRNKVLSDYAEVIDNLYTRAQAERTASSTTPR